MKNIKRLYVELDTEADKDIIEFLDAQGLKTFTIKILLRLAISKFGKNFDFKKFKPEIRDIGEKRFIEKLL